MALRGISPLAAVTLTAERGDFSGYAHAAQLMAYLGLFAAGLRSPSGRCSCCATALAVKLRIVGGKDQSLQAVQGLMADMTGGLVGISTQTNALLAAGSVGGVAYDVRIRRAIDAMKLVRGTTPDFDELAKAVGLSRPHFFLQDIAFELGFDSPGNFTRFFARKQGVTPRQYRRNVQFVDG
jgi:hypothetical protein